MKRNPNKRPLRGPMQYHRNRARIPHSLVVGEKTVSTGLTTTFVANYNSDLSLLEPVAAGLVENEASDDCSTSN